MGLTKKFLVDTTNFEEIAEKLRTTERLPDKINTDFIEQLGYSNPPDFLILNFFKELNLLTDDNAPTTLFKQFRNPQLSKKTLAYGIVKAYSDLFEKDPTIYERSKKEILEEIRSHLGNEKSDLILKYMTNTFSALINYVGREQLESALHEIDSDISNIEKVVQEIAHKYRNGDTDLKETSHIANGETPASETEEKESKKSDLNPDISSDNEYKNMKENKSENPDEVIDKPESQSNETVETDEEVATEEAELPDDDQQAQEINEHPSNHKNPQPRVSGNMSRESEYLNKAYIRKAELLQKLGRLEEALTATDEVYQRFASADDPELYYQASLALVNKMKIAEEIESKNKIIPIYTEVINRLGSSDDSRFTDPVDRAFVRKAEVLFKNSKNGEALDITEKAIDRFKGTQRKQDFLSKMMFKKAEILDKTGSEESALQAYDDFLDNFG